MSWNINKIKNLYRYSAIYDIVVTGPFAIPWLSMVIMDLLVQTNSNLQLGGYFVSMSSQHYFALNLLGIIVSIWSIVRIKYPYPVLGFYDGLARIGFSSIMLYYMIMESYPIILVTLLVPEISWGVLQMLAWVKTPLEYRHLNM